MPDHSSSPRRGAITFVVPAGTPERHCSSCGAPIYWIATQAGKRMPVDCDTTPTSGTTIVSRRPTTRDDGRGIAHWATCPHAEQHRKRR